MDLYNHIGLNCFNQYWVATLFSQVFHIVRCIKDVVCNVLSNRFTRAFMHAESIQRINSYTLPESMLQLLQK